MAVPSVSHCVSRVPQSAAGVVANDVVVVLYLSVEVRRAATSVCIDAGNAMPRRPVSYVSSSVTSLFRVASTLVSSLPSAFISAVSPALWLFISARRLL